MLFDPTASTGFLVAKMKKKRQNIKRQRLREVSDENTDTDIDYTEENAKTDIELMRTSVVTEENLDIFKEKAVLTHKYRLKLLLDRTVDLQEIFPYFLVRPDLVSKWVVFGVQTFSILLKHLHFIFYSHRSCTYSINVTIAGILEV